MQNNFNRVLVLVNCYMSLAYVCVQAAGLHSFIQRCERYVGNCQHIKKSRLKLDQITNDLLPYLVIVLRRINFKSIQSLEEHWCRHSCFSCPVADTNQSCGDSGCTLRTIVINQQRKSIQCLQIHLNQSLFRSSSLLQCQARLNHLNSL